MLIGYHLNYRYIEKIQIYEASECFTFYKHVLINTLLKRTSNTIYCIPQY